MALIDPTLYGGKPLAPEEIIQTAEVQTTPLTQEQQVQVGDILQGTRVAAEVQARQEEAARPEASMAESAVAAVQNWAAPRIYQRITRPTFETTPGFNLSEFLNEQPLVLSHDELEYVQGVGLQSLEGARYAVEHIKEQRELHKRIGDNPAMGLLVGAVDPLWLPADVASAGAARVLRAGRAGAAVAGGAVGAGITASQEGPVSTQEILSSVMLNAGAAALVYRGGKLVKADPDFPDEALKQTYDKFTRDFVGPAPFGVEEIVKPKYREVVTPAVPAVFRETVVPATADAFEAIRLPNALSKAKPRYRASELVFESDIDRAAYITAQARPSKRDADYLKFVQDATGWSEQRVREHGALVRTAIKALPDGDVRSVPKQLPDEPKRLLKPGEPARVVREEVTPAVPERREFIKVGEVTTRQAKERPELVLHSGASEAAPEVVRAAVESTLKTRAQSLGASLEWSLAKTMRNFGPVGEQISEKLFGDVGIVADRAIIRGELSALQAGYEDSLRTAMAQSGAGLWKRITSPREAVQAQGRIEAEVQQEMFRRAQLTRQGRPITHENIPQHIKQMADQLDALHARALNELKAAGVEGAEDLVHTPGWQRHKWSAQKIEEVQAKFKAAGKSADEAHTSTVKLVQLALRTANKWDSQLSYDVAASIVNRALRKGYFEDALFTVPAGEGQLKMIRDLLKEERIAPQRIERILGALQQQSDDAGKAGFLKHRVDIDYRATTFANGETIRVTDLLDNRLTTTVEQYLDGVSTQAAYARAGLRKTSDVDTMRSEFLKTVPAEKRGEAAELFDNINNHLNGRPAGQAVNGGMRLMSAYGRMIALANSGFWQVTEWATAMSNYGALKTIKYAMKEMPGYKALVGTSADKATSRQLADILTFHSEQNLRLRPFVHRFEDNFEMGADSALQLAAQQAGQLVPYVNVLKYIHSHQARTTANLVVDRLRMAANGDKKAIQALGKYGLDEQVMDKLRGQFDAFGMHVDKWDDGVWAKIRPALGTMMDEAVLHSRLGDMPAFATFDNVGKFLFAYRGFTLTAHNKILAGGLERHGFGALSLLLAYQMPLAAAAAQAQSVSSGKGALSEGDMAKRAVGLLGGIGLASELVGVAIGGKSLGALPGAIPIDKAGRLAHDVLTGDLGGAAETGAGMIPIISLAQPWRATANLMKED